MRPPKLVSWARITRAQFEEACRQAWNEGGFDWDNDETAGPHRAAWRERIRRALGAAYIVAED